MTGEIERTADGVDGTRPPQNDAWDATTRRVHRLPDDTVRGEGTVGNGAGSVGSGRTDRFRFVTEPTRAANGSDVSRRTDGVRRLWSTRAADVAAPPIVTDDAVYVATGKGIAARRSIDGTERWSLATGRPLRPIAVDGDRLYAFGRSGRLTALDASDGEERWSIGLESELEATPTLASDTVVALDAGGTVVSVDAVDGSIRGRVRSTGRRCCSLSVGGLLYAGSIGGGLYALDRVDGSERWRFEPDRAVAGTPVVCGDRVFVGTVDAGSLIALDATSGRTEWTVPTAGRVWSSMAVAGNTAYGADTAGRVYALDAEAGTRRWVADVDAPVRASLAVSETTVYASTEDGLIRALDRHDGDTRWTFETKGSGAGPPAVRNGDAYVASAGRLYALSPVEGA